MTNHPQPVRILVCPLDWGLGHATRCIPLIRKFLERGAVVTLAASGRALQLLRKEFPLLEAIELPGFSPTYPASGKMVSKMFRSIPSFIYNLIAEKRVLSKLNRQRKFDIIVSDNRYGLFDKDSKSILIIHQIRIKTPAYLSWAEPLLYRVNCLLIARFDQCWIPDFNDERNLSGELSHACRLPHNAFYIGPLTRFAGQAGTAGVDSKIILAVLSGPEPQRSMLEQIIIRQSEELDNEIVLIGGRSEEEGIATKIRRITIVPFATTAELEIYMKSAHLLICRPGYSTIMDLAGTGGKALFIPTPGQTEQEYLGSLFYDRGIALSVGQEELNLKHHIPAALLYRGFEPTANDHLLENRLDLLFS